MASSFQTNKMFLIVHVCDCLQFCETSLGHDNSFHPSYNPALLISLLLYIYLGNHHKNHIC